MTLNYTASTTPMSFAATSKYRLQVRLQIPEDLRSATWKEQFQVVLGGALERNCEALAQTLFSEVVLVETGAPASEADGFSTLTPRLIAIARDRPAVVTQEQRTTILLEWTLSDPHGAPVWAETIEGTGRAPMKNTDRQVEAAVKDLFERSYAAMTHAPEIRSFAARAQASVTDR